MVECDSESKLAHALVELVEDREVTIDSVVLGDKLKQRHFHKAKNNVVCTLHGSLIVDTFLLKVYVVALPLSTHAELIQFLLGTLDNVVAHFEYGSLVLEILENARVHLQTHLEQLAKHRVQRRIKYSGLVLREVFLEEAGVLDAKLALQL